MLFDLRTYRVKPGTMGDQLALYRDHGFETQRSHLGEPHFYGLVETGDVNTYTHIWRYEGAADRERRRQSLYDDENWLAYRKASAAAGHQVSQVNTLLKPAPFWLPT